MDLQGTVAIGRGVNNPCFLYLSDLPLLHVSHVFTGQLRVYHISSLELRFKVLSERIS
ncbi:hypothetical protein BB560_005787, partial [Smittium megazygosporum]